MTTSAPVLSTYRERSEALLRLADAMALPPFRDEFIRAYISDTAFTWRDVMKREIETPSAMLRLPRQEADLLEGRLPLGKVAILVPRNSLALTLVKAIASAFLTGNEVLVHLPAQLKQTYPIYSTMLTTHLPGVSISPQETGSAEFMRQCLRDTGIKAIVVYGDDAWIDAYHQAAEASGTKLIFEGPGNDPLVIMPGANMEQAVRGAIEGGLNNGGQSCSAFERFFVQESVAEEFSALLVESLKKLKTGSPYEQETDIGPVSSRIVLNRMVKQLKEAEENGAEIIYGGEVITEPVTGLPIVVPAVLKHCRADLTVVEKETFGPVFPIITFRNMDDLMPALDATNYGLNASVYGDCTEELLHYLKNTHRNVYQNSTCVSPENLATRLLDGGFRRSGFIWEQTESYCSRTGPRLLTLELSHEA